MTPTLDTRTVGETGTHVVFLHGLFGQGRNFTTLAARLAESGHRVTTVDLPNHGHSPWTDTHSYPAMAEAVAALLDADDPVVLLGHSMGGKTAMTVALHHPELLRGLVVVDIAPVDYPVSRSGTPFDVYVEAMRGLDLSRVDQRSDADAALRAAVPDAGIRAFLLQSLVRDVSGVGPAWRWRLNLDVLAAALPDLGTFPTGGTPYPGPVLWLAGAESDYVTDAHRPTMDALFPQTRLVRVKGAGHWVHAEAPEVFLGTVSDFVARV